MSLELIIGRTRCLRTFVRFPQRSIEHHRRVPGREVSTKSSVQSSAPQIRILLAGAR